MLPPEPEVLFLDEPTTGLDSASAHSVVKYISNLAKQTKVVCIMTIHQVNDPRVPIRTFSQHGVRSVIKLG